MAKQVRALVVDILVIALGTTITAVGLQLFLIPNRIAGGGASGLATILYHLWDVPVGIMVLVINIPLFIIGLLLWGWQVGWRTLYSTVLLSLAIDLLEPYVTPLTQDPLLAAIYGGLCTGIGMGLVFRHRGTTGGTDLAARLVNHFTGISLGQGLVFIDTAIVILAGFIFNIELALYAAVSIFVLGRVIDMVQEGFNIARAALIITNQGENVRQGVLQQMGRGITLLPARGGYTGKEQTMLICVISRSEVTALKRLVAEIDPRAFVIITGAREVLGEGFKEDWESS